eukprot:Polyplicarium_translucidae@DN855_c0_g2_i1.p1
MREGRTEPPPLLSESDLIDLMDKSGIGTDATMHEHIHTIQERHYAARTEGDHFEPTQLGLALVNGFSAFERQCGINLSKPDLRSQMESDMQKIATGRQTKLQCLGHHVAELGRVFALIAAHVNLLDEELGRSFRPLGSSLEGGQVLQQGLSQCGRCAETAIGFRWWWSW